MTKRKAQTQIVEMAIAKLRPYPGNARTHSKKQLNQIALSIERFGFTNPVLVSNDGQIIAGHGRVEAAKLLGMKAVPTIALSHMSPDERRAYVLADNKLAMNAGWDKELLAIELEGLVNLDFDLQSIVFEVSDVDFLLDAAREADPSRIDAPEDDVPATGKNAVTRPGDIWVLGNHRLICGDSRDPGVVKAVMDGDLADMAFLDPPYNVPIDGNVCGKGAIKHKEFAFASGEMSEGEFTQFLTLTLQNHANVLSDGAIAFVCMDWRHMSELLAAGRTAFNELKNLVVWNKTNGGMGTFYRSKHELIFVFKNGKAEHTNNFQLGQSGRYRTNVWDYAGISSISPHRQSDLAMHPTIKPVALIADAILDCSKRGDIVLDGFGGSGSTLIAAHKVGRLARLVEYDPLYCDTTIRRWQLYSGQFGKRLRCGTSFDELELGE